MLVVCVLSMFVGGNDDVGGDALELDKNQNTVLGNESYNLAFSSSLCAAQKPLVCLSFYPGYCSSQSHLSSKAS